MKKIILSILVLIPILGPLLYFFLAKDATKREKLISLIALIPAVNVICAILLIVSAVLN